MSWKFKGPIFFFRWPALRLRVLHHAESENAIAIDVRRIAEEICEKKTEEKEKFICQNDVT